MGKNLKGRECGKGIYQRKDGKHSARHCARDGKRQEKYFDTLPEARNWLADAKYEDKYGIVVKASDMLVDDIKFLTLEEQQKFLETAKKSHNYRQYALLLETGLRTAELIGLTWDSIDWKKHTLTVNKSLEYRHKQGYWRAEPPKTEKSYRTIPLTDRAYQILKDCYAAYKSHSCG